jgi:hypothetical protein
LRPDRWAAAHPEHIRDYRVAELHDRAVAEQTRRDLRRRSARRSGWHRPLGPNGPSGRLGLTTVRGNQVSYQAFCRGRDTGCPVPPARIRT